MTREQYFEDVVKVVRKELNMDSDREITENMAFKADLACDSLDIMGIVSAIEDLYNIEIETQALANLNTIGDVVNKLISLEK